jgi:hypothetical protein
MSGTRVERVVTPGEVVLERAGGETVAIGPPS